MNSHALRGASRACLGLALLTVAPFVPADTTWTNLTGNQRWNILINWSAGVPDILDVARFPALAAGGGSVLLDPNMLARALTVESDYRFSGGSLSLANGVIDVVGADTELTFASELGGVAGLTKRGQGTLALTGNATFSGTTRVAAGTLELRDVGERLPDGSKLIVDGGARLHLTGNGFTETLAALEGDGTVLFDAGTRTLRIGAGGANGDFSGDLVDQGSGARLVKIGTDTQVLRGDNVLGRGLGVDAGRLILAAGGTRSGDVDVAGGARLEVSGAALEVMDRLTVAANGAVTLGDGAEVSVHDGGIAGGEVVTAGTLELRGAGALLDLSARSPANAAVGGAGGKLTINGGSTAVTGGARVRAAGGPGGEGGAGGSIALTDGTLRLERGTLDLAGGAAGKGGTGQAGLVDVTGGVFELVAGVITDGRSLLPRTGTALLGARLRVADDGRLRLLDDFTNVAGDLLIAGGAVDGTGATGLRGRNVDNAGRLTLTGAGQLVLRGGQGGNGGALHVAGELITAAGTRIDLGGGDGAQGASALPFGVEGGRGGDGGDAGELSVDGGQLLLQGALALVGGAGGAGGSGILAQGAGGDGGLGGRVRLLAGAFSSTSATLDLRGGVGGGVGGGGAGVLGPSAGGAAGAAGSFEQRGGVASLQGTRLLLAGRDGRHSHDGLRGGAMLLLGGDMTVLGGGLGPDILADGGDAAITANPLQPQSSNGGQGGRLEIAGAGRREFGDAARLSFDGGAGGGAFATGGSGGAGGDLWVRGGDLHLVRDAVASFSGGHGGLATRPRPPGGGDVSGGEIGSGGDGGSVLIEGGRMRLGLGVPVLGVAASGAGLVLDGGDAGNVQNADALLDRVSTAGNGGVVRVRGGNLDLDGAVLLSLRGGRGGRLEEGVAGPSQGGAGGLLSIEGGSTAVQGGAIVDLGGGDAVVRASANAAAGGRGGEVRLAAQGDGRLVLNGGALALAGGQGNAASRGASGQVVVEGGELRLVRGLVTGAASAAALRADTAWTQSGEVRLTAATLTVRGGSVDVSSTLRLDDARVDLDGGTLRAARIVRGTSAFEFDGGRLDFATFEGSLANAGGRLEVGHDAGVSHVLGDYTQSALGTLAIDILDSTRSETLRVTQGRATLGGRLVIGLADDVTPLIGSDFDVLVAEQGVFDSFQTLLLPERAGLHFALVTRPDRLVLEVRAGSAGLEPVPLPPAAALFVPALLALWRRRRRG